MDQQTATLAGLLHDIGKFWQRAASTPTQRLAPGFEELTQEDYGRNGTHATWSAAFINQYLPKPVQEDLSSVLYHHNPKMGAEARLLALADQLASGERADVEVQQPFRLESIFTRIGDQAHAPIYMPIAGQSLTKKALFPLNSDSKNDTVAVGKEYEALWKLFADAATSLQILDDQKTITSELLQLLSTFTSAMPAATYRTIADVSLYDHSRVTGAVAACLSGIEDATIQQMLDSIHSDAKQPQSNDASMPVACLLEGDISGVQRFIYTITARGATPALRGRSFYLQMLTDVIARFILQEFGLSEVNLIYAGGGHFYLLLPPSAQQKLPELQRELDRIMLKHHNGDLFVALGYTTLTCTDFQRNHFSDAWRRVGQAVGECKRRRFANSGAALFATQGHGGNEDQECQVCHYEGNDVHPVAKDDEDASPVRKCALCQSLEELGRDLRDATQLLMIEVPKTESRDRTWQTILAEMGMAIAIRRSDGDWTSLPQSTKRASLLGLEQMPPIEDSQYLAQRLNAPVSRGLRWSVNIAPKKTDGRRATFEDLQNAAKGIARLGVLRMDVDNLGWLFSSGFRRFDATEQKDINQATLSRVASVSTALSRFLKVG